MIISLFSCYGEEPEQGTNSENNINTSYTHQTTEDEVSENTKEKETKKIFLSALKSEITVYETNLEEYVYMKDCKAPSEDIPLLEITDLRYAYVDFEGDEIGELVIYCDRDTLILRYYEDTVYLYPFVYGELFNLKTDGTYSWNNAQVGDDYGENKIYFEGAEFKPQQLWRIVDVELMGGASTNKEGYYLGSEQVEREEWLVYYNDTRSKADLKFSPLELSRQYLISSKQAFDIALDYFGVEDGHVSGACGTSEVYRFVFLSKPNGYTAYYRIAWQTESYHHIFDGSYSLPRHIETYKELLIDARTGECFEYVESEPDGKGGEPDGKGWEPDGKG